MVFFISPLGNLTLVNPEDLHGNLIQSHPTMLFFRTIRYTYQQFVLNFCLSICSSCIFCRMEKKYIMLLEALYNKGLLLFSFSNVHSIIEFKYIHWILIWWNQFIFLNLTSLKTNLSSLFFWNNFLFLFKMSNLFFKIYIVIGVIKSNIFGAQTKNYKQWKKYY
jgi:hypothetical protein